MLPSDRNWGAGIAVILLAISASIATNGFLDAVDLNEICRPIVNGFVIGSIFVASTSM